MRRQKRKKDDLARQVPVDMSPEAKRIARKRILFVLSEQIRFWSRC